MDVKKLLTARKPTVTMFSMTTTAATATIYVKPDVHRALKVEAARRGIKVGDVVELAVDALVAMTEETEDKDYQPRHRGAQWCPSDDRPDLRDPECPAYREMLPPRAQTKKEKS